MEVGVWFRRLMLLLILIFAAFNYYRDQVHLIDLLDYVHKNPTSTLAIPMTNYYVGMFYFARDQREAAERAFTQLLTDYPTSEYTGPGTMRLAQTFEDRRKWAQARDVYQQYFERFPEGEKYSAEIHKKFEKIKFNN